MKIQWTEEKTQKVKDLIEDYIIKHNVTCGESVQQCDIPYQESPNLVANIVDTLEIDSDGE